MINKRRLSVLKIRSNIINAGIDTDDGKKVWIQYKGEGAKERTLWDSQIIYISYSSVNSPMRISYVERLIRSFIFKNNGTVELSGLYLMLHLKHNLQYQLVVNLKQEQSNL